MEEYLNFFIVFIFFNYTNITKFYLGIITAIKGLKELLYKIVFQFIIIIFSIHFNFNFANFQV